MYLAAKDIHGRLDLERPRWREDRYIGRVINFLAIADPRNSFKTNAQLEAASKLIEEYRLKLEPSNVSDVAVWSAKHLYDSAYHPETGEKLNLIGRMSSQTPLSMFGITAWALFYKSLPNAVLWGCALQGVNAITNFTNRSDTENMPTSKIIKAYVSATGLAFGVGLGVNATAKYFPRMISRFMLGAGIISAHVINIPLMRQNELKDGIRVTNVNGETLGYSVIAARHAIAMTTISRVGIIMPVVMIPTYFISKLKNKFVFLKVRPKLMAGLQVGIVGGLVSLLVPLCCAIYPQRCTLSVNKLEQNLRNEILEKRPGIDCVYFNKGL